MTIPAVVLCPGYHGHNVARTLGRLGVPMYGVHQDAKSPAARSRFWRGNIVWDFAHAPADATVERLLQLAVQVAADGYAAGDDGEEDQRPVLIATDDDVSLFVSDHAPALRSAYRFPEPPRDLVRALTSKKTMYELCRLHGIPVAETRFPRSRAEVEAFAETARFPIMVKGVDTLALQRRTGFKMLLARDAVELLHHYDILEDPRVIYSRSSGSEESAVTDGTIEPQVMLQEYLAGGSGTLWMFDGYFDDDSRCLFGMTGQKIREYPAYTGRTSLGVCLPNPTVAQQSVAFMQALGYRGPLDLDYKYDERTGEYKLIDVNPRLGTTFRLFVDSSELDVVRALYLDLTGQPVVGGQPKVGRKWLVENFEALCLPTYLRGEPGGLAGWLSSYRGVAEACWFAPDDPAPFLALVPQSARWALAKRGGSVPEQYELARPASSGGAQSVSITAPAPAATRPFRLTVIDTTDEAAWDAFVATAPGSHYAQSSLWARIKETQGWQTHRVIARDDDGRIVGGAQYLLKRLPLVGAIAVAYKAPLIAVQDPELEARVATELNHAHRRLGAVFCTVQPPEGGECMAERLRRMGYVPRPGWGHCPATTVIDLTQDVDVMSRRLRRHTRRNLRIAQRSGVQVREGTAADIEPFYRLHATTSRRRNFTIHSLDFYRHLWQLGAPSGQVKLFVAELAGEPLATALVLCFGDTVYGFKSARSGEHNNAHPNTALVWEVLMWAKRQGFRRYDFVGLDSTFDLSFKVVAGEITREELARLSTFKLGFGGEIITSPIAYEYVPNPILRHAYNFARDHATAWRFLNAALQRVQGRAHR